MKSRPLFIPNAAVSQPDGERNFRSVMPGPPYSADQIRSIITYIKTHSPGYVTVVFPKANKYLSAEEFNEVTVQTEKYASY